MARNCRKINSKTAELKQRLQDLFNKYDPSSSEYEDGLNMLRLEFAGPGGHMSIDEFEKILLEKNVDVSSAGKQEVQTVQQLQNSSLAFKHMNNLYKNATTAFGFMQHDFKSRMFKALFIDNTNYGEKRDAQGRLLNDVIVRVPQTGMAVNSNIVKLKNELLDLICSEFSIENPSPVFIYAGNKSKIDADRYRTILLNPRVNSWLARVNPTLETADTHTKQIHSALFILNNFDDLVTNYLPKILKVDNTQKGLVSNVKYTKEFEGNAPSIWSADDLSTYGSDLYASNLGKFILGTINKVDSDFRPIEGSYMSSQDAFVIAALLREAEYEYHILKPNLMNQPYDPELTFKTNLTKTLKVLLDAGINDKLDCLKKYKKEIYPVYNWLYNTNDQTIAVQQIYKDMVLKQQIDNITSVLNLENVLANEIVKNAVPTYLEYSAFNKNGYQGSPIRTINVSHTFRGTSYITQNLKATIYNEFLLDTNEQNQILASSLIPKRAISELSVDQLLQGVNNDAQQFQKCFELLFGIQLSREFLDGMHLGKIENAKNYITDIIYKISEIYKGAVAQDADSRETWFQKEFDRTFLSPISDFRNKYVNVTQTVADRKVDTPITIIKNSEGKSIPIYRLGSTIFEDIYLINQLKKGQSNRNARNFLIGNSHVLSNINNPRAIQGSDISKNMAYQGCTGLKLETISSRMTNGITDSSAEESYINSFFGDFLGLGVDEKGHSISVQLMTLSDKSSVFTKIINLDAVVDGYGLGENAVILNKSIDSMSNQELKDMYYFYRKNQIVDEVFHIIGTWNKILGLGIQIPDINMELANGGEMLPQISNFIDQSWSLIKQAFQSRGISKSGARGIEKLIRDYQQQHPNEDIELVKDLHYSFYKGVTALNKNIYYHFKQIKTKSNFANSIEKYIGKNLTSEFYTKTLLLAQTDKGEDLIKKYCDNHGIVYQDKAIPYGVMERKLLLENFFRSQLMDLHFKGAQLDAIKSVSDYDEQTDNGTMDLIEADAKFKAAGKRTVDLGGTKQNFAQGLIDGVSEEVKVAHIEEPKEEVWNPLGETEDGLEILNGSGRISYIYAMMESASMTGAPFRGVNRKTLGEGVHDYYSTLYKWAEFLINNWHMRNSHRSKYSLEMLFRKMHDINFNEDIDLTKSFLKPDSLFTPAQANGGKSVYFATGMHYYRLNKLIYKGNNTYDISITEVNDHGEVLTEGLYPENLVQTQNVKIDNLYSLFKVLGGTESMELDDLGILRYSDSSLQMLYNYVINIGTIENQDFDELDQSVVRQPLRDKFIAIAASNSGIKRGETNTNSKKVYTDAELSLLFSKLKTALFGSQMDVYHAVSDESTATEPTQTLAALATNGNTREEANRVYNAIASIIESNMRSVFIANKMEYDEDNATKIIKDLTKEIIETINDNGSDLQRSIVELCQLYLGGLVPISDTMFYTAFNTFNIQQLNKLALKRKYSGLGGVLNPSNNSYQLFNINGQELEFDDLVKRARNEFRQYEDVLNNFTTYDIANLYLFSQTDKGRELVEYNGQQISYINYLFEEAYTDQNAQDYLHMIADTIELNLGEDNNNIELIQDQFENAIEFAGHKITKTEADPLDTVFYEKDGKYYKTRLDTAEKYFNFVNDPNITNTYLDITTPHDLKPQIIKYTYNGETHSLYESDASEMNYLLNSIDDSELDELLADAAEESRQLEQKCK